MPRDIESGTEYDPLSSSHKASPGFCQRRRLAWAGGILLCIALVLVTIFMVIDDEANHDSPSHSQKMYVFPSIYYTFSQSASLPALDNFVFNAELQPAAPATAWIDSDSTSVIFQLNGTVFVADSKAPASIKPIIDTSAIKANVAVSDVSANLQAALVHEEVQVVWRHSSTFTLSVLNIPGAVIQQFDSRRIEAALWCPSVHNGTVSDITVVYNGNILIWRRDSTGKYSGETVVTTTGNDENIRHGRSDWGYEEEVIARSNAIFWHPSGQSMAYMSFNDSAVDVYTMNDYVNEPLPETISLRYPFPGRGIPTVELTLWSEQQQMNIPVDLSSDGLTVDNRYIYAFEWISESPYFLVVTQNRNQNYTTWMLGDQASCIAGTGCRTSILLERHDSTWTDPTEVTRFVAAFDSQASHVRLAIALASVETAFRTHLRVLDITPAAAMASTDGGACLAHMHDASAFTGFTVCNSGVTSSGFVTNSSTWDVTAIHGMDLKNRIVIFDATAEGALTKNTYGVSWDRAAAPWPLIANSAGQYNQVSFSGSDLGATPAGESTFVLQHSGPDMPFTALMSLKPTVNASMGSEEILRLADNKATAQLLDGYSVPTVEFTEFFAADNQTKLNAVILKPSNFSSSTKYPVLMYAYGGPGSQSVTKQWQFSGTRARWHAMLASQGVIIVIADGRGTGGRGAKFMKQVYRNLGDVEVQDQLAVAEQLKKLFYVNSDRVGFWGWSYGGYVACKVTSQSEGRLRLGMSVAPVADWRFYDAIYTERYMGTPQDNAKGYSVSSTLDQVQNIQDGAYLLVHGTADDNVHFLNSAEISKRLISAQVMYQSMYYPNQAHGLSGGGAETHVWRLLADFVQRQLVK